MKEPGPHAANQLAAPLETLALWLDEAWIRFPQPPRPATPPVIAIHPGSGGRHKIWPLERCTELLTHLHRLHPGARFLAITGEAEHDSGLTSRIREAWSHLPFEPADFLSLVELSKKLPQCAAFLGHDSGISHLAATCGVPCFLLFGPTDPAIWSPQGPSIRIVRSGDATMNGLGVDQALDHWNLWFPTVCPPLAIPSGFRP
jgi:ADP-heptose:LPS heptosyltransferase